MSDNNETNIPAPKRRWFRFSLRTLFVTLTVLGCWLGYEVNWIRQRREIVTDFPKWQAFKGEPTGTMGQPPAPGLLWLFGEPGYAAVSLLVLVNDLDDADDESWPSQDVKVELQRVSKLFPEAMVGPAPLPRSLVEPEIEEALSQ